MEQVKELTVMAKTLIVRKKRLHLKRIHELSVLDQNTAIITHEIIFFPRVEFFKIGYVYCNRVGFYRVTQSVNRDKIIIEAWDDSQCPVRKFQLDGTTVNFKLKIGDIFDIRTLQLV